MKVCLSSSQFSWKANSRATIPYQYDSRTHCRGLRRERVKKPTTPAADRSSPRLVTVTSGQVRKVGKAKWGVRTSSSWKGTLSSPLNWNSLSMKRWGKVGRNPSRWATWEGWISIWPYAKRFQASTGAIPAAAPAVNTVSRRTKRPVPGLPRARKPRKIGPKMIASLRMPPAMPYSRPTSHHAGFLPVIRNHRKIIVAMPNTLPLRRSRYSEKGLNTSNSAPARGTQNPRSNLLRQSSENRKVRAQQAA